MVLLWRLSIRLVNFQLYITWCSVAMHFSAEKFWNYLNTQHKSIKFASQMTEKDLLWFLDIQISYGNNKFVTLIYRKPTFSGIFPNIESLITDIYKRGSIEALLRRSFRLCSNYENFHQEMDTLKSIFKHNSYHHDFVNHCIKKFLNKLYPKGP